MAYVEMLAFIDLTSIISVNDLMEILDVDKACAMEFMSGVIALTEEELMIIAQCKGIEYSNLPIKLHESKSNAKDNKVTFTYYGNLYYHD